MTVAGDTGLLVMVVGASGVGKDAILKAAMDRLSHTGRVHFPQRVITRADTAGGESNIAVTREQFQDMLEAGTFMLHWQAHGLCYGIPGHALDPLSRGDTVIFNGSRTMIDTVRDTFNRCLFVTITADPVVRANRLNGRGRESGADIASRLARVVAGKHHPADSVSIDNSGLLEDAVTGFIKAIEASSRVDA